MILKFNVFLFRAFRTFLVRTGVPATADAVAAVDAFVVVAGGLVQLLLVVVPLEGIVVDEGNLAGVVMEFIPLTSILLFPPAEAVLEGEDSTKLLLASCLREICIRGGILGADMACSGVACVY